jgi:hypothetical protein
MNVQTALLASFRDAAPFGREAPDTAECPAATAEREELEALDPVVSAALLVASAFRLRDEGGLIATLRLLTNAVSAWESQQAADCPAG